jgi:hypothetical protein
MSIRYIFSQLYYNISTLSILYLNVHMASSIHQHHQCATGLDITTAAGKGGGRGGHEGCRGRERWRHWGGQHGKKSKRQLELGTEDKEAYNVPGRRRRRHGAGSVRRGPPTAQWFQEGVPRGHGAEAKKNVEVVEAQEAEDATEAEAAREATTTEEMR